MLKQYFNVNETHVGLLKYLHERGGIMLDCSFCLVIGLFNSAMKSETGPYIKEEPQKRILKRTIIKERVLRNQILKEIFR
jgi:hypothetical protein